MRTLAIVLVFGLAVSSMAVFKKAKPFKADIKSIEALQKKETVTFGDFVNFFQTHTFQQNDQLISFLDNLNNQILQEHEDHLNLYTEQREECSDEFDFRASEISNAEDSLGRSQTQLHLAQGEQTRAANLADLAGQSLNIYNQQLDDLRVARAAQVALYTQRRESLDNAVTQVQVAQNILDEFELEAQGVVPVQFVQLINSLLALTVRTGHSHKVLPIYSKLIQSQAKGQFDVSDIQELRELFDAVLDNLYSSGNTIDDQENDDAATFAESQDYLVGVIGRLNDQLNLSADYISRLAGIIEQEQSISLEAQGKIARNTELLDQAHGLCDDADLEFQQGESIRRGQLELISQLKTAVQALEVQYAEQLLPNIEDLVSLDN
jgi:hypothetical protein